MRWGWLGRWGWGFEANELERGCLFTFVFFPSALNRWM